MEAGAAFDVADVEADDSVAADEADEPEAATSGAPLLAQPAIYSDKLKAAKAPKCFNDVFLPFDCMVTAPTTDVRCLFRINCKVPHDFHAVFSGTLRVPRS